MTVYRKRHPYEWMKDHLLKPDKIEVVFRFFILWIGLILFSYLASLIIFSALKALNIIEADFFQFFGGQGVTP